MSDDKPFLCPAPGCGQRFTNEDHLAVHKHKHEMTLKFGPARDNSVIVADQTPTPTRFLKNCEEVGLFNELTSPFEHDFKKATEDDLKKMPLDLSPLATPMIIQNKIEDHSAVEAHRGSPLPHPESTTSDDKEVSLQPTSLPTSTIVHPASLQVPNVLLATSDASVVIQQALPSPTSSSVITQVPSSNRPIVPVSGTFPVLFQLPNGQTMPVAIPATIASSVHIPTAIPLVRPVTVVPNVPGIPGPPSPQAVQSEAKLVMSLSQYTYPPALEPCPQTLQQPATSTTETPAHPAQHTGGRRRRATSEDPDEKRRKFLERNRAAASRCRQKRKVWVSSLEKKAEDLNSMNGQLQVYAHLGSVCHLVTAYCIRYEGFYCVRAFSFSPCAVMKSLKPIKRSCGVTAGGVRAPPFSDTSLSIKLYPPDVSRTQACPRFCLSSLLDGL
uniref:Cyclic AMP-dependent transcription factor ATF-2 n=1 Tax=Oncorhynchus tshawytscha TaxID=74940 RepID=A0A8C8FS68_ONCTS